LEKQLRHNVQKAFNLSGRILASLATILFGELWTGMTFGSVSDINVGIYFIVMLVALGVLALSLRKSIAGGIGLIMLSAVTGIIFICTGYDHNTWLLIGLPYLVAGILQIAARSLSPESQPHSTHGK
jgi:apolipoprotein N-acyltransferase